MAEKRMETDTPLPSSTSAGGSPPFSPKCSTSAPESSSSLLASLRKANLAIEREDSIDVADVVIERAIEEHQVVDTGGKRTLLAQRLQSIEEDQKSLKENMNLASTTPAEITNNKENTNEHVSKSATVIGVGNEKPKFLPKPSGEVTLHDDVDALVGMVKKTKEKKPISEKYLRMLDKMKSKSSPSSPPKHRSKYYVSSEASRLSQLLNRGDDSRWAHPRSGIQFKSQYEEKMFRSMQKVQVERKKGKKKSSEAKRSAVSLSTKRNTFERLSQVKKTDESLFYIQNESGRKYASFDDAKNCTFMPRTNESKRRKEVDDSNDRDNNDEKDSREHNFILRQEASERKRVLEKKFQKGKQEYDALVDKKRCPICKATQSYDEVKEKRKNCPNCQVAYTYTTSWNSVKNQFYKRQNDAYQKSIRSLEEKKKEVIEMERKSMKIRVNSETGEVYSEEGQYGHDVKWTRDVEEDFFTRMEESKIRKERNIKCLDDEVYGKFSLNFKSKRKCNDQTGGFYFTDSDIDTSLYYS